jgi:hypothetical protein
VQGLTGEECAGHGPDALLIGLPRGSGYESMRNLVSLTGNGSFQLDMEDVATL